MARRILSALTIASAAAAAATLAACGEASTGGTQPRGGAGTLHVVATTTGTQPDVDGYTLDLTGRARLALASTGAVDAADLAPGTYTVTLAGLALNCRTDAAQPLTRTVAVEAGRATTVAWDVHCVRTLRGLIAYDAGGAGIFVVDTAGGTPRQLVPDAYCPCFSPAISPDGTQLAFWSQGVVIMNVDSTGFQRVTPGLTPGSRPAWSPDGRRLAFVGWSDQDAGRMDLYVQDVGGASPPVRLTYDGARVDWPAWSPDGTRLAFTSRRDTTFSGMLLYTIRPDGTGLTRVRQGDAYDSSPAWLADGSGIVVANEKDPSGPHLEVLSPSGAVLQRSSFEGGDPSIAPRTGRVAFVTHSAEAWTLTTGRPDGTDLRPVYTDPTGQIALPNWGPTE